MALVGWVTALLTIPLSALVAAVVVSAAVSLVVATGVGSHTGTGVGGDPGSGDWRRLVDRTLLWATGAVAALGLLQVSVAATALSALVLGATAPWALSAARQRSTEPVARALQPVDQHPVDQHPVDQHPVDQHPVEPAVTPVPVGPERAADPDPELTPPGHDEGGVGGEPAEDLSALTTGELVLAWRRSYAELLHVRTPSQQAASADRRQRLLDELERRDAEGVERWLRSGARAASDPSRFLQRRGPSAA